MQIKAPEDPDKFSAAFIGEGSLLVECAQIFLRGGHEIRCIVSADARIGQWATEQQVAIVSPDEMSKALPDFDFDLLFSIVNLSVIPPETLKLARKLAINFHDALLPAYAGLHATTWAILNQEKAYGITWHEMTAQVDAGRILRQERFDLAANETALSLNTKCFEAAIRSFPALLSDLEHDAVDFSLGDPAARTYYSNFKRPSSLVAWDQAPEQIAALIRALDFGPVDNPLARAKVLLPSQVAIVSGVEVLPDRSGAAPGTIIAIADDAIQVSTAGSDLEISRLSTFEGAELPVQQLVAIGGVRQGDVLPEPMIAAPELASLAGSAARHEAFWVDQLVAAEPLVLSGDGSSAAIAGDTSARSLWLHSGDQLAALSGTLASDKPSEALIAAFACYLARISSSESFALGFEHPDPDSKFTTAPPLFAARLPLCIKVDSEASALDNLRSALASLQLVKKHQTYALDVVARYPKLNKAMSARPATFSVSVQQVSQPRDFQPPLSSDLTVAVCGDGSQAAWYFNEAKFSRDFINTMQQQFESFLAALIEQSTARLRELPLLSRDESLLLELWNQTEVALEPLSCIQEQFERQVELRPDSIALAFRDETVTYAELNRRANKLARHLKSIGVGAESLVAISTDRSPDMLVAVLAVLKAGAGYIPLDPAYPKDRLQFIAQDSGIGVLLTQKPFASILDVDNIEVILVDEPLPADADDENLVISSGSSDVAYVIYTSGSTGKPKGVVIEQRAVANFFAGMDARLHHDPPGVWLAVTSLSFDISVLELLWTLCRGFKVVLYEREHSTQAAPALISRRELDFSLFYFGSQSADHDGSLYDLLLDSAKFADERGWTAIWTPERHFHAFGGAFPNPSVLSAALAVHTKNIGIRAGSSVLPLHSPIRVAEEWSIVDNLSGGRVGVSFASGWQPNDFVLKPENFKQAKAVMIRDIDTVRRLWRGETVTFPGHEGQDVGVEVLPRPLQSELPIWLTSAGSPETFATAGQLGVSVLTHLLGQSFEELKAKIAVYRRAWQDAGHSGDGHVTLMLHTFVGSDDDVVRETVREPMKAYLASSVSLIKDAAWAFPTFKRSGEDLSSVETDLAALSADQLDAILEQAFNRYYKTSGLFGSPEHCAETLQQVSAIGVDEVACLLDFGLSSKVVMEGLGRLEGVRQDWISSARTTTSLSVPTLIKQHGVTHLQCTPSMAYAVLRESEASSKADQSTDALSHLDQMLVGGEALPKPLADELLSVLRGDLINMYGPTETTIWSTCHVVERSDDPIPIGRPIANTQIQILDGAMQQVPVGATGEIYIGGLGVARGYFGRPDLTNERFVPSRFVTTPDQRLYRTGDLGKYSKNGDIVYQGRTDFQVKIRGHRIELGEIENVLLSHDGVGEVAVLAQEPEAGDQRLVAYWTTTGESCGPEQLREHCRRHLPDYMVPQHFVKLPHLPLTPNGKIDRKALMEVAQESEPAPAVYAKPEDDQEEAIAEIWRDVLKASHVDVTTNFFDMGGHSLLALQLHRRLVADIHPELLLTDIFRFPTVRTLAQFIAKKDGRPAESAGSERAARRKEALSLRLGRRY